MKKSGSNGPADKIERWALDKLTPYARNSRTHSPTQVAQLAASIREWGWTTPILVDESGSIIAGHGRVLAARQLEMIDVPVIVAKGWSDAKRRAYIIADNKLALNAGWDDELLKVEIEELTNEGFDFGLVGFSSEELDSMLNGWKSDIESVDRHGHEMETIDMTVRVKVAREAEDLTRETIAEALTAAGVSYELV